MKNYRPEKDPSMLVFYVLLDGPTEKKPQAAAIDLSRKHLALVVNR